MTDTTDTPVVAGDTRNHNSTEATVATRMAISEYAEYGQIPFVGEDNDGLFLYIPSVIPAEEATDEQITAYLKTLAPISISTYRYNSNPVDTTQIIRGEKWVNSKVYDPGVLYNLEAKKIDIKEETIVLSSKMPRGLESDTFEIKFQEPNSCCLNKAVLNKDISNSCTILPIEVDYRITRAINSISGTNAICSGIKVADFIDSLNTVGAIVGIQDGFNAENIDWWLVDAGKVTDDSESIIRYPYNFTRAAASNPDSYVRYDFDPGNAFEEDTRKSEIKIKPPVVRKEFDLTVPVPLRSLSTDDDDKKRFANMDFTIGQYLPGFTK